RRLTPETVYTHSVGDLNIDHVVVHRAVLTATRPIAGRPVRELYSFEVPSATEWAFGEFAGPFRANLFVDVTATLDVKIQALKAYESEMRAFPHPRSTEAIRAMAQRWGSAVGVSAAEAFNLVRMVR